MYVLLCLFNEREGERRERKRRKKEREKARLGDG